MAFSKISIFSLDRETCIKGSKILHRDLKPSNVFFDSNNNVKLGDFGLSKIIKCESTENQEELAQTNVGTHYYMSPG